MTTKLMFVPDTHAVVPREPTDEMVNASWMCQGVTSFDSDGIQKAISIAWHAMVKKAPQLTTPPVLRWEKPDDLCSALYVGSMVIASVHLGVRWVVFMRGETTGSQHDTEQEARRAAEKALGFPEGLIIPEV